MRFLAILVTMFLMIVPASATLVIVQDGGGAIDDYLVKLTRLRDSGENVVIDGKCYSACTLILGIVPHNRLCITARASFGFHMAWMPMNGHRYNDREGSDLLLQLYPPEIRAAIARHGGLRPQLFEVKGRELASIYPVCRPR